MTRVAAPSFAQTLREARQRAGLSQAALGRRAGLTAPYISLLESGRRRPPSPPQVERLARALNLEPGPWLEQASVERSPLAVRKRLEGLDRERGKVSRARDRILTNTLFRFSQNPALLQAMGESPEEAGSFGHLIQMLTGRMRGVGSAREAEHRSGELLERVSARERDRLIEALPEMLAGQPPPEPGGATGPVAVRPTTFSLEVRAGLTTGAPVEDHLHVDARWASAGAFLWRLASDDGWPRLAAGDLLLVDPVANLRDGDLVALHLDGRDEVRTLRRPTADAVRLESLRSDVPPLRLAADAFLPAGVVTHVLRTLR